MEHQLKEYLENRINIFPYLYLTDLPSRAIKTSTFVYCISFFGVQLLSVAANIHAMLCIMRDAYPYDHVHYMFAVQSLVFLIPNIMTFVSWCDTNNTSLVVQAWDEFAVSILVPLV